MHHPGAVDRDEESVGVELDGSEETATRAEGNFENCRERLIRRYRKEERATRGSLKFVKKCCGASEMQEGR